MAHTKEFRTKTLLEARKNPHVEGYWEIAIDIGYSGTKIFAPNKIAIFPSFATPLEGKRIELLDDAASEDILYRDMNGKVWQVGRSAQNAMSAKDSNASSMSIYGRERYFSPMYKVMLETALGIAMKSNELGDSTMCTPVIQTGLPNAYLKSDKKYVVDVFSGQHKFWLKVGNSDWEKFELSINPQDVKVISQPMGTLLSVTTNNDGTPSQNQAELMNCQSLLVDPGFGTMDCFAFENKTMKGIETFDNLGMKRVMQEASAKILKEFDTEIPVPAMQKYLETGIVTSFNRAERKGVQHDITEIVNNASKKVAKEAIDKIYDIYSVEEYDYLVLTGGTGEAWVDEFKEGFAGLPSLSIIMGNNNDPNLSCVFANVRGYYLYLYLLLKNSK